jgi:hypothetical protein
MTLRRCYKATVNESETITDAQPFCSVRSRGGTGEVRAFGRGFPGVSPIERS